MATRADFFLSPTVGGGASEGIKSGAGFPTTDPYPLSGGELNDIFKFIGDELRKSASAKDIVEALGETYDPSDPNQLKNVLQSKIGDEVLYKTGAPVIGDFVPPVKVIIDDATGKIYTKKADGTIGEAGGSDPLVKSMSGVPVASDFSNGILIIEDTGSGKLYTKKSDGTVAEIGGEAGGVTGTKAGKPTAGDFTGTIKEIVDTTTGRIYVLKDDGTVAELLPASDSLAYTIFSRGNGYEKYSGTHELGLGKQGLNTLVNTSVFEEVASPEAGYNNLKIKADGTYMIVLGNRLEATSEVPIALNSQVLVNSSSVLQNGGIFNNAGGATINSALRFIDLASGDVISFGFVSAYGATPKNGYFYSSYQDTYVSVKLIEKA